VIPVIDGGFSTLCSGTPTGSSKFTYVIGVVGVIGVVVIGGVVIDFVTDVIVALWLYFIISEFSFY
jgi:hypothetical protein